MVFKKREGLKILVTRNDNSNGSRRGISLDHLTDMYPQAIQEQPMAEHSQDLLRIDRLLWDSKRNVNFFNRQPFGRGASAPGFRGNRSG